MARLVYSVITSLDGYVADADGGFDWAAPDEEVHTFVNDLERPIGTYLYGRRMYEVMQYWDTAPTDGDEPAYLHDYARIWQAADKVVYSRTVASASIARTRIERELDVEAVRELKATSDSDLSVGGPLLAAAAIRAGLVDELHLLVAPVAVGGGTAAFPAGVHLPLQLVDQRRFAGGMVHLHYRTA